MNQNKLEAMLIEHEGERFKPYLCSAGKTTIGVGRNLTDKGITQEESRILFKNDIRECAADLPSIFPEFSNLPKGVKMALMDMRFQLGPYGIRKFQKMIRAVNSGDWVGMISQMRDSLWYRQVTSRAEDLIKLI
jgi:lysozyme